MPNEPIDLNALRPNWTMKAMAGRGYIKYEADANDQRPEWARIGRHIYEAVPNDQRPGWARAILLYVAGDDLLCDELARVVGISIDQDRWMEAHDAFRAVRRLALQNEELNRQSSHQQLILRIGETAAKLIYNASGGPAPFDRHAGWYMAFDVRRLVEFVGRKDFEDRCWHLLIRAQ